MPTVRYRGFEIACGTAEEAADIVKRLQATDSPFLAKLASFAEAFGAIETSHWTRDLFWKFLEALGDPQKEILTLLVKKRKVTAQEMRQALKLDTNQQLAGILSGISKQAGAHNVPARSVYTIENESQSGGTVKSYVVARDFLGIATDQNWPAD